MHLFTMQHQAPGIVPSSHIKLPSAVLPLTANATARGRPLSGVLNRQRSRPGQSHLSWGLLAASNPSTVGDFICTNNTSQLDSKLRVDKYFEAEMTVQDCELDKYEVVNNAIYASYIDKACKTIYASREELLVSLGISTGWIIGTDNAMALLELNLKYLMPLRRGDKFVVKVRLVRIKGVRIYAEHLIEKLPERELVLDATATIVCLSKDYRPTRVFPEMSVRLQRFFSSKHGY